MLAKWSFLAWMTAKDWIVGSWTSMVNRYLVCMTIQLNRHLIKLHMSSTNDTELAHVCDLTVEARPEHTFTHLRAWRSVNSRPQ